MVGTKLSIIEKERICYDYDALNINGQRLAKKYNRNPKTIYRVLKNNNIKIKPLGFYNIGKKITLEHKQKIGFINRGKPKSEETKKKISIARKRWYSNNPEKVAENSRKESETKKRLFKEGILKSWNKGKPFMAGENHPMFGKTHSKEARLKISLALKGRKLPEELKNKFSEQRRLEKNANWQGGVSFEPYTLEFNDSLKERIRKRDDYTCLICNSPQENLNERLHIHHINYNKKCIIEPNLVSLCRKCHLLTNYNRNQWKLYFQSLLKERYDYEYSQDGEIIINLKG